LVKYVIAEIGNNHFGQISRFKDLAEASRDAGADLLKGRLFRPQDITDPLMPSSFYENTSFTLKQAIESVRCV